jgi:hypothetical protein
MKLFKWVKGRQASCAYYKLPLAYFRIRKLKIGFDMYILNYDPGVLPNHKDPVDNGNHYRLNIKLCGKALFWAEKVIFQNRFITLFRPDLYTHTLIITSKTKKLSIGFVFYN